MKFEEDFYNNLAKKYPNLNITVCTDSNQKECLVTIFGEKISLEDTGFEAKLEELNRLHSLATT